MIHLILVSVVWAFSFSLIKGTLAGLDSNFVSLARMALSFLVFAPFIKFKRVGLRDAALLAAIGAVQFGLMYVAYIASFKYLPAYMVALLTTTTPLFVTLVNDLWGRRVNPVFFIAALFAVAAGILVKYPSQALGASLTGVALVQVSNIAFAAGQVAYTRLAAQRAAWKDTHAFGWLYAGALGVTAIFSLVTTDFAVLRISSAQAGTLIYLGVIASGVCFFLWNVGARRVNAGTLATMNNLKIPLGILVALLLLREQADLVRLGASIALMAVAVWLCERRAKTPDPAIH